MSRNEDELARIADRLVRARADGRELAGDDLANGPRDRREAYRVQSMVCAHLGPVAAFKTGRKAPDETPIMAPIAGDRVRASPAVFGPGELRLIGIELEVAFLVHDALPDANRADFGERTRRCVSALAAIEIVDSRLADMEAADPLWKLADNQCSGGFVYGAPVRDWAGDWAGVGLQTVAARLEIDDEVVMDGAADVPGGDAFETFCAFAKSVGRHCGGLVPGQYVTTGTVSGVRFIEAGRHVKGCIGGLGCVEVAFSGR